MSGGRRLTLLIVGIALLAGWLGLRFSTSFDLTANERHSLSSASLQAAAALDGPLELIAVMRPERTQVDALTALVERFRIAKPDITLTFVNPDTDPARARSFGTTAGAELILRNATREQRLQNLSERTLVGAMRRLGRESDRDIVFITGHDERSPSLQTDDDLSELAARLARSGLASREVSLVAEPHLAESIDVVVLAAPRRPYFPGEIASLMNYIRAGGNLLWLAETPSESATGPGLEALADDLGVDVLPGHVIDTASQALDAETPDFVLLDRFPPHPITQSFANPVLLPQARALTATALAGQETLPILVTPESSWTEQGALEGEIRFDENTDEVAGPLLLGLAIERARGTATPQRMAVIGDADFAASRFLGNGANAAFAESVLLWLAGDGTEADFITVPAADAELTLTTRARALLVGAFLALVPGLLLIVALIVWRRQR